MMTPVCRKCQYITKVISCEGNTDNAIKQILANSNLITPCAERISRKDNYGSVVSEHLIFEQCFDNDFYHCFYKSHIDYRTPQKEAESLAGNADIKHEGYYQGHYYTDVFVARVKNIIIISVAYQRIATGKVALLNTLIEDLKKKKIGVEIKSIKINNLIIDAGIEAFLKISKPKEGSFSVRFATFNLNREIGLHELRFKTIDYKKFLCTRQFLSSQ